MKNLKMNRLFGISLIIIIFGLSSCAKCVKCDCYKDGVKTTEEDCSAGRSDEFERKLMAEKDYDECDCKSVSVGL